MSNRLKEIQRVPDEKPRRPGFKPRNPRFSAGEVVLSALVLKMYGSAARNLARLFDHKRDGASSRAEPSVRAYDRDRDPERDRVTRERWGTALVAAAYLASATGGVVFLISYWTGAGNAWLGGSLALFLGGIGCGLVFYSHKLMAKREAVEAREELASSPAERERAWQDICAGAHDIRRRGLLTTVAIGAAGFGAAIGVSLFRSLGAPPGRSLFDTVWKQGQRLTKMDGTPVSIDALEQGSMMIVFPEDSIGDEKAQTVLIRVDETRLRLPEGRGNWAPKGYVAYSRVCTHAGCPVGMFEATTDLLMCPCHQSTFDVLRGANPTGGPAARALPQLPLYADADGMLRAGGGFTEPPGPGFWGMPS